MGVFGSKACDQFWYTVHPYMNLGIFPDLSLFSSEPPLPLIRISDS